jgi:hypothetical protein
MTPNEFKAWFDGFTEAFTGCPTKAQWARIKARVAEIDGKPVTQTVYLDRYWPTYIRTYPQVVPNWASTYCGNAQQMTRGASGAQPGADQARAYATKTYAAALGSQCIQNFNSSAAMGDLGRAEAKSLVA